MTEPSSSLSAINEIQRNVPMRITQCHGSPLRNHKIGFNQAKKFYMSGEVHEDCLDKGYGPAEDEVTEVGRDRGEQLIVKNLGGIFIPNCIVLLHKTLDLSAWKADQQAVYDHVKKGNGNYARLLYALDYYKEYEMELHRPCKIFYCFELYNNEKMIESTIEGVVVNKSLRYY